MHYFSRRLAHGLFVLIGVSLLSFLLVALAPGDFLNEMKLDPRMPPETVAALRDRYGLDRPRARNTLLLTVPATTIAWLIAVPLGAWSASRRGRWDDRLCAAVTTGLLLVPELLLALALLLFAVRTGYFPVGGMTSLRFAELGTWDRLHDLIVHMVLPASALILLMLPVLIRHVRASLIDVLATPFIQAARARGVPHRRLLFRDALRAAANPLLSLMGLSIAGLLSMSLVVEALMSWPGLGPLLLEAIAARDLHVVIGAVMCSTLLLLAGNLLADALLYMTDPRIRADQG